VQPDVPRRDLRLPRVVLLALLVAMPSPSPAADALVSEAVVNAPVEAVWNAWTTVEGIQSWMVAKTDIDLRVGGLWRTSYTRDADLAGDAAIHHRVLAFDPGRMLAFQTIKTPKNFPFANIAQTWTVVYLEPAGAGKAKVTVRMVGYGDDQESVKMRAFFEKGNKATLDALVKRFAAP
jgi:uncharacterized protein YndB with AHSA1/START domain